MRKELDVASAGAATATVDITAALADPKCWDPDDLHLSEVGYSKIAEVLARSAVWTGESGS